MMRAVEQFVAAMGTQSVEHREDGVIDFEYQGVQGLAHDGAYGDKGVRASFFVAVDVDPAEAQAWVDHMPAPPVGELQVIDHPERSVVRLLVTAPADFQEALPHKAATVAVKAASMWSSRQAPVDLLETLATAGIAPPPVHRHLDRVRSWGPWQWGTGWFSSFEHYMFEVPLVAQWVKEQGEVFALSHAGHGLNSYGLNLVLAQGPVAAYVQHGYGGAYMEPVSTLEDIAATYARLHVLLEGLVEEPGPPRWLLLYSSFRGYCGLLDLETFRPEQWQESFEPAVDEGDLFRLLASKFPTVSFGFAVPVQWERALGDADELFGDDAPLLDAETVGTADPAESSLGIDDLIVALRRSQEFANGPGEQRDYWQRRLAVLRDLFGVDTARPGVAGVWPALEGVAQNLVRSGSAFAGFMEVPHEFLSVIETYGHKIGLLEQQRQELGDEVLRAVLLGLSPDLDTLRVPMSRLVAAGGAVEPPDYDSYDF